jgi:hypothetical protein
VYESVKFLSWATEVLRSESKSIRLGLQLDAVTPPLMVRVTGVLYKKNKSRLTQSRNANESEIRSGCPPAASDIRSVVFIDPDSMVSIVFIPLIFLACSLLLFIPCPLIRLRCRVTIVSLMNDVLVYLIVSTTRRELQIPQGYSPEPVIGSATCIIDNMRGMPILYGGLVLDPEGLAEPKAIGGCEDTACSNGTLVIFDKPAHGWETIEIVSSPYPESRAGHTMTGERCR